MKPSLARALLIAFCLAALTGCLDSPVGPAANADSPAGGAAAVAKEAVDPAANAKAPFEYEAPPQKPAENYQGFGSN